jgi:hypothetical protein
LVVRLFNDSISAAYYIMRLEFIMEGFDGGREEIYFKLNTWLRNSGANGY